MAAGDEHTITIKHPYQGGGGCVRRVYIVVHEPGKIPDKKCPQQSNDGVTDFLLQLELCKPKGTTYTVVQIVWDGDIWVESGAQWLEFVRVAAPRKFAQRKKRIAEEMRRYSSAA